MIAHTFCQIFKLPITASPAVMAGESLGGEPCSGQKLTRYVDFDCGNKCKRSWEIRAEE
jgi:hypothetical protein